MSEHKSVLVSMADRFGMEPHAFEQTLRATVVPANCSKEQFAAFLLVAKQYNLNPITKEIYAFPSKAGGIQPIVGVDGWMKLMNDNAQMDGMEFVDILDKGELRAIECHIYRKDRSKPTTVIEYMSECKRDTDPWKRWPARMLRHKAAIQCARYAFGFSGIIDPDEYERGVGAGRSLSEPRRVDVAPPPPPEPSKLKTALRASIQLTEEEKQVIDDEIPGQIDDPDKYLDDLHAQIAATKTTEQLSEVWEDYAGKMGGLFPPDRDKADKLFDEQQKRIEK